MKIYRSIIIGITIIIAIVLTLLFCHSFYPTFNTIGTDHPNQEDFNKFKEYSLMVAKTLDEEGITDQDAEITWTVGEKGLIITIVSHTYGYGVVSIYPIYDYTVDNKNAEIKGHIQYQYENVKHTEYFEYDASTIMQHKTINLIIHFFEATIFSAILSIAFIYFVLY